MSNPFGGMGGLGQMMAGFQQQVKQIQQQAEQSEHVGQAGGGLVTARVNGKHQLLDLEFGDGAGDDLEMLADLIIVAVNNANQKAQLNLQQKMSEVTAGLPIPPGMLGF